MIVLVTYLSLIFLTQTVVRAQDVISWETHILGKQLTFPWYKDSTPTSSPEVVVKSPSGRSYTVKCFAYDDKDTRVDIYTDEGIFVDTLAIVDMEPEPCGEMFLRNYVIPQDAGKGEVKIMYLWAGNSPKCVVRKYDIHEFPILSYSVKYDYPKTDCPQATVEFIKGFPNGKAAGGIVSVGPMGISHDMDFNSGVKSRGTPTTLEFPTKDLRGKFFKLICREDSLKSEDPETKQNTILTGMIVHEKNEEVILEKFKLKSCSVNGININRQIFNGYDLFKIVFKTVDGECFEKEVEYLGVDVLYYFNLNTLIRNWPTKVKCPNSFVGDINLNAAQSLHRRILAKIFGGKKPYAVEVKGINGVITQ